MAKSKADICRNCKNRVCNKASTINYLSEILEKCEICKMIIYIKSSLLQEKDKDGYKTSF